MKVIGVVGYPASGKGEFSQIAAGLGIPVVVMGDIIRRQVSAQGLDLTDENIGATARKLREDFGMDAVAMLTAEEVGKAALSDKKRSGGSIKLILPVSIGECMIYETGAEELPGLFGSSKALKND